MISSNQPNVELLEGKGPCRRRLGVGGCVKAQLGDLLESWSGWSKMERWEMNRGRYRHGPGNEET